MHFHNYGGKFARGFREWAKLNFHSYGCFVHVNMYVHKMHKFHRFMYASCAEKHEILSIPPTLPPIKISHQTVPCGCMCQCVHLCN